MSCPYANASIPEPEKLASELRELGKYQALGLADHIKEYHPELLMEVAACHMEHTLSNIHDFIMMHHIGKIPTDRYPGIGTFYSNTAPDGPFAVEIVAVSNSRRVLELGFLPKGYGGHLLEAVVQLRHALIEVAQAEYPS